MRSATRRRSPPVVHSVSSVPVSRREEHDARVRNYLISMSIRTLAVALAGFFLLYTTWTVLAWICVAAAVLLPYPAVVLANNVNHRTHVMPVERPTRMIAGSPHISVGSPAFTDPSTASSAGPASNPPGSSPPGSHATSSGWGEDGTSR